MKRKGLKAIPAKLTVRINPTTGGIRSVQVVGLPKLKLTVGTVPNGTTLLHRLVGAI